MFDKTVINQKEAEPVPYCREVHVHKAPTDDSVRLYGEVLEKAYKSILETIESKNNILNVSAFMYQEPSSISRKVSYRVIINDREITGKITIDDKMIFTANRKLDLYIMIVEKITPQISAEIIKKIMAEDGIITLGV